MQVGAFGLGDVGASIGWGTAITSSFRVSNDDGPSPGTVFMGVNCAHTTAAYCTQIVAREGYGLNWRCRENSVFAPWARVFDTRNTTKASDGTLKAASPVARIVQSKELNQRTDIAEKGFSWCGCGTANEEAEGVQISRLDVGVYMLTGSSGLASEGWQLLPPMDPGGMGELGVVEAEQTESGGLTIHLFKRKYMLSDEGEIVKTKGEPMDVPVNSWIDVRLDMPDDSAFNQRINQELQP
ncbi:phage tail protein, partial [Enterobacter hormaechei]